MHLCMNQTTKENWLVYKTLLFWSALYLLSSGSGLGEESKGEELRVLRREQTIIDKHLTAHSMFTQSSDATFIYLD